METNVELLEDNRAKITVTVEAAQVDAKIAATYKEIAQRNNFPGFRKGKAPRAVINSMFGPEFVPAQVTEDLVNENLPLAIDASGCFVVGEPSIDTVEPVKAGTDFVFSFAMSLRAEIELTSYDAVEIELPAEGVVDAEVEDQLQRIADQQASFTDAGSHAKAGEGDRLVMKSECSDDKGNAVSDLTNETLYYTIGSGLMPEAFDTELTGIANGETREFTIALGDSATALTTNVFGTTENLSFKVEVTNIMVKKAPEITDEWVKEELGFESVAELRERISESLAEQKSQFMPRLKEDRCISALLERVTDDAPQAMVDSEEASILQDFFRQLQSQGMTYDAYLKNMGLTKEQLQADIKEQAAENVKQMLALDAWARHAGIECTDADVQSEFIRAAQDSWESVYEQWKANGQIYLVREGVLRSKALDQVVEGAVVTEVAYGAEAE